MADPIAIALATATAKAGDMFAAEPAAVGAVYDLGLVADIEDAVFAPIVRGDVGAVSLGIFETEAEAQAVLDFATSAVLS